MFGFAREGARDISGVSETCANGGRLERSRSISRTPGDYGLVLGTACVRPASWRYNVNGQSAAGVLDGREGVERTSFRCSQHAASTRQCRGQKFATAFDEGDHKAVGGDQWSGRHGKECPTVPTRDRCWGRQKMRTFSDGKRRGKTRSDLAQFSDKKSRETDTARRNAARGSKPGGTVTSPIWREASNGRMVEATVEAVPEGRDTMGARTEQRIVWRAKKHSTAGRGQRGWT